MSLTAFLFFGDANFPVALLAISAAADHPGIKDNK